MHSGPVQHVSEFWELAETEPYSLTPAQVVCAHLHDIQHQPCHRRRCNFSVRADCGDLPGHPPEDLLEPRLDAAIFKYSLHPFALLIQSHLPLMPAHIFHVHVCKANVQIHNLPAHVAAS